jgi:hypothetical protein
LIDLKREISQIIRHEIRQNAAMDTTTMGPMVPEESSSRLLEDDTLSLVAEASRLAGRLHPILVDSIGDLVRSMNCYYSNLIEVHDTHPRDIDRTLANDFSAEPKKRDLQKEAVAHIHVQRLIDTGAIQMRGRLQQLMRRGCMKNSAHDYRQRCFS